MKKVCISMMSILLSLLVVQLTVGVTLAHCLHTGRQHIVSLTEAVSKPHAAMQNDEDCAGMGCAEMGQQHCMEYSFEQLSASVQAPVFHHDFTAVQPLLFTIWSMMPSLAQSSVLPQDVFFPDKVPIPPRAYLAQIRVLLI